MGAPAQQSHMFQFPAPTQLQPQQTYIGMVSGGMQPVGYVAIWFSNTVHCDIYIYVRWNCN